MKPLLITNRLAYSLAEVARSCNRHPSWAYRLAYRGKIRVLSNLGTRILVPASELDRLLSAAAPYNPKPKKKRKPEKVAREEAEDVPC